MIVGLDHIAVAVSDWPTGLKRFMEDFALQCSGKEDLAEIQTKVAFFPLGPTNIELIHPLVEDSPVGVYLEKNKGKGGLHHLSFRSDDIEADIKALKAKGYEFLSDEPLPGAHNSRVIFIHPKCCDGVLVELTQAAADGGEE